MAQSPVSENEFDLEDIDKIVDFKGVDWKENAEQSLRLALPPVVLLAGFFVLAAGLVWASIDRPFYLEIAGLHLVGALTMIGCGVRWRNHPPKNASAATALLISGLYLLSAFAMVAYPDPVLGLLPLFLVAVTAFFVVNTRWMLFAYAVGFLASGTAVFVEPPTRDLSVIAFLLVISLLSATSFRITRISDFSQLQAWRSQAQRRDQQRRRAVDLLQRSESALLAAQRIARVGSFVWVVADDSLHWSDEHYRIFGLDPKGSPITNARFIELVHPDDRAILVRAFASALADRIPVDVEFRIKRDDGTERFLHGRGETEVDSSGQVLRHRGTSHDITERKHAEEALRSSQERLRETLEALDASNAVVLNRKGVIQSVLGTSPENNRYGLKSDEVAGSSIRRFIPGEEGRAIEVRLEKVFATGRSEFMESVVDFSGRPFHFDTALRPLHDSEGRVDSVLAMVHDVTPRVEAAQALEHARRLESLGVLAGGIAHDFNNLLVGILGNADLAFRQTHNLEGIRDPIEQILISGERAAELTRRLLAYAGRAELSFESIHFPPLVDETTQLVRASIKGGASIRVDHVEPATWIRADVTQVGQVVMNLVRNAAEAIGDSGGQVEVKTEIFRADREQLAAYRLGSESDPGDFLLLEVADDGPGMDDKTVERIFDPFFTTKFDGRGLGLASALGIVRGHGGAIQVKSAPGAGTQIRVLFPLAEEGVVAAPDSKVTSGGGSDRILLVDDESAVRRTTKKMLASQGYSVIDAASGAQALELLQENQVDLALLDVTMPGMDGLELFEAIRKRLPDLPVIMMSGHSPQDVAGRLSGSRRVGHLQKPFRLAVLGQAIETALASGNDARL
ncbi:MAG: response regulator [Myxococcota bacterium]|nr:response regulator [Myxococcota bacterium]